MLRGVAMNWGAPSLAAVLVTFAAACGGLAIGATGAERDAGREGATADGPHASQPDSGDGSSCAPGESRCAGVCVDEQTDPKDCGGCGVLCAGQCVDGRCLVTIASMQCDPKWGIAVDATSVYWTNACDPNGPVMKAPLDGGTPTTLAESSAPTAIAVDATSVYWTNLYGGVMKVPLGGGATTTLTDGPSFQMAVSIAVDDTSVYWSGSESWGPENGMILSVPLDGGAPTTLASGQGVGPSAGDLAVDATSVYWGGSVGVMKMPKSGGTPTTLVSTSSYVANLAVNATNVYWIGSGGVMKVPVAGGAVTPLADGSATYGGGSMAFAVDATNAYWITNGAVGTPQRVMRVPLSGGTPTTLLSGGTALLPGGTGWGSGPVMAVSATSLYWTEPVWGKGEITELTPK
jgi:hypothetical protein